MSSVTPTQVLLSARYLMTDDPGGHSMLTGVKTALVGFLIATATITVPLGAVFTDFTNPERTVKINKIVNTT